MTAWTTRGGELTAAGRSVRAAIAVDTNNSRIARSLGVGVALVRRHRAEAAAAQRALRESSIARSLRRARRYR